MLINTVIHTVSHNVIHNLAYAFVENFYTETWPTLDNSLRISLITA
jgi:hypothetical protein